MLHSERQPRVSIVIPCYNHGQYIDETIQSIEQIGDANLYEIIIVNDGSTDEFTNHRLDELAAKGKYKVVKQENGGVAKARNHGFSLVRGEYILPVDSDNKITPAYVYRSLEILDTNPDIAVVYSDSMLIGMETGIRVAGEFNLQRLMLANFIDNCAVFRKKMMDDIGPHDTYHTINGIEDWEFWLRAAFKGYKFHYINEPLYEYRVLPNSGAARLNASKLKGNSNMDYFRQKHPYYFGPQYVDEYFINKFKASPIGFLGKLILKIYFPKKFHNLVQKGKLRKYI